MLRFLCSGSRVRGLLPALALVLATVASAAPGYTLSPSTVPNGTLGESYSASLAVSGVASPPGFNFAVSVGTLPPGLSLVGSGTAGATIAGTPTVAGSYSFTIKATEAGGPGTASQAYSLAISPPPAPVVVQATGPNAGTYGAGDVLDFTLAFDRVVTVVGGTPTLTLTIGNARRLAYYAAGSGTTALTFRHTVQPGDNDADGITCADSVALNGATMRSGGAVDAERSFTPPDTTLVRIDTAPIVTGIRRWAPRTVGTPATSVVYRVTFSEPVTGVDAADFVLNKTMSAFGVVGNVEAVDAMTYAVTITGLSGVGTVRLDLKGAGTGIVDRSAQPVSGGFSMGQIYVPMMASFPVGWGRNVYGRLGDNTTTERHMPSALHTTGKLAGKYLVDLAAGGYFSIGLTADGQVFAWGRNADGQLGVGTNGDWFAPQPVSTTGALQGKTITAIAAGGYHALAVDAEGRVYAWGRNAQGQLGNRSTTDSNVPVAVYMDGALAGKRVVAVAAGDEFSVALTDDGLVYTWGDGGDGQLGHNAFVDFSNEPVAVGTSGALNGKFVTAIAAGSEHVLALTSEGKVYAWGSNGYGQLGTNMFGTNRSLPNPVYHGGAYGQKTVVDIACGWDHSIALTADGRVYVWGENDHGQVGNNSKSNRNDPGIVSAAGVLNGKTVAAVTGGDSHTTALTTEGRVYDWGFNDYGQLGNDTEGTDTPLPVAVDTSGALAGKTVVALGSNWGGVFNLALAVATTGPRIMAVLAPPDGVYQTGDTLALTVQFNAPVAVTTAGGVPYIDMIIGSSTRALAYASGSGTDTLTFSYTVQADDRDIDGLTPGSAIVPGGGTIKDAAGLTATLDFTRPTTSGVFVNARPIPMAFTPAVAAVEVSPGATLSIGFSESVTAVAGKKIVIRRTGDSAVAAALDAGDAQRVTISGGTVTIVPGITLLSGTAYAVEIEGGAFLNAANFGSAAMTGSAWNFVTRVETDVSAADSDALASYLGNPAVERIYLQEGATYHYAGGRITRPVGIQGNGATIQAGAGVRVDVVRADDVTVSSAALPTYTDQRVFFAIDAGGALTLRNVTLQNNGADALANGFFCVIDVKSGGTFDGEGVTLEDFHNNPTPGNNLAFGIHAEPSAHEVRFVSSTVSASNAFRNAVAIRGGVFTIEANTFGGTDHPDRLRNSDGYEYAVYLYGGSGSVRQNQIRGYDATTQLGYSSAAIALIGYYPLTANVSGNTLADNSVGIDVTRAYSSLLINPASRPTVTVNSITVTDSASAFALGENLRSANVTNTSAVSLDQTDEVLVVDSTSSTNATYYTVLGGYRWPYLEKANRTAGTVDLKLPATSDSIDILNAATTIAIEQQLDEETTWSAADVTWAGTPHSVATASVAPNHVYRFRVKLTHQSATDQGDPEARTLVTYSGPVEVVDDQAPDSPSAPDLAPESDTGASDHDDVTAATTPTFTGTAESGVSVTLYDGEASVGSADAVDGRWSITTPTLAEGDHTFTARAKDAAGNSSALSPATTITVDTTAPTITSGPTSSGRYMAVFGGCTVTAAGGAVAFDAAGLPAGLSIAGGTGVISGTPTTSGTFAVALSAKDAAGNTAQATLSLEVGQVALTVTGITVPNRAYDGTTTATLNLGAAQLIGRISDDQVTLVASGAVAVFADPNAGAGKAVTVTGLGLTGSRSRHYTLTPPVLTGTITRAVATVTLGGLAAVYDGAPKAATATTVPVGLPVTLTYDGAATAPTAAGVYAVAASVDAANYTAATSGVLEIAQAAQIVSFPTPSGVKAGQAVTLTATATSGLPVTFTVVSGNATLTGSSLVVHGGAVTLRATQAGDGNFLPASATVSLAAVEKIDQTITFSPVGEKLTSDQPFALNATASSGLPVSLVVVRGPALLSGSTLTLVGTPGEVEVRASQPGNETYNAAPEVTQTFSVTAVGPLVYFGTIGGSRIAISITPDGGKGTMIGTLPNGEGFVVEFTPGPDGAWEAAVPTYLAGSSTSGNALAHAQKIDAVTSSALTTQTRVFRGFVNGTVVTGAVPALGVSFDAQLVPPTGPTTGIAGYYESASLQTATGAIYTIVGTQNQVYVLAITPTLVEGASGTAANDGTFAVTASGDVTISGSVDAPTTVVTGTLIRPNQPPETFAGIGGATTRTDRLVNLSSRGRMSGSERVLITGFVVGGNESKRLLLRGVGPGLTAFGLNGVLPDPKLRLYRGSVLIAENDNWGEAGNAGEIMETFRRIGAFDLAPGSADAAILVTLPPGVYTAHVYDGGKTGVAMAEIYDASVNPQGEYQRLVNISTRGYVGTGEDVLIGGFVVTGNAPKKLLVRGVGPGLQQLGVGGVLADPRLRLFHQTELVAENDNWGEGAGSVAAEVAAAASGTGAFGLASSSRDAALILTLAPGTYTAQVSGVNGGTGVALIEIYEIAE